MSKKRTALPIAILTVLALAASPAVLAQYNNDELRDQITGLGVAHNIAFPPSLAPIPGSALVFGNTTYATNLGLKYVPPVVMPPPTVGAEPNTADGCGYTFTLQGAAAKTRQDYLGLLTDLEDGFVWNGFLNSPEVYHVNTDVEVSVFAGSSPLSGTVTLPVGSNSLRWQGRTLATPMFDYPPWHLVLAKPVEAFAKRATVGLRSTPARRAAAQSLIELFAELGIEGATAGADWSLVDGIPVSVDGQDVANNQFQTVQIYDRTLPVFTLNADETGRTEFTVEATRVGGEFLRDHIDTLRDAFSVSDTCDRVPSLRFSGEPFIRVGETAEITWTASDAGPTSLNGGVNKDTFTQTVTVQDTLPPILLPPPGRVIESDEEISVDIGQAAVFDLADVRPVVSDDAPDIFSPDTRTLVTWSAVDASGNSTSKNQWITLKTPGSNVAPVAMPQSVDARTFDPIEIELSATDADLLSGRFDQLSFSIESQPANGFFVAPLFPYFIEDHRVENAFGISSEELRVFLNQQCFDNRTTYVPPVDFVKDPRYITVTDEGIAYVSDEYYVCNSASAQVESRPRISRFIKNAAGKLEYDRQSGISDPNPPDSLSIDGDGFITYIDPEAGTTFGRVLRCDPLLTNCEDLPARHEPGRCDRRCAD